MVERIFSQKVAKVGFRIISKMDYTWDLTFSMKTWYMLQDHVISPCEVASFSVSPTFNPVSQST